MHRQRSATGLIFSVLGIAVLLALFVGCGKHSSGTSDSGWSSDDAKAFRGSPPPPGGENIAEERRRAGTPHPAPGFSTVAPAPRRPASN